MSLINCPECGKQISSKAYTCVNCGYPLIEEKPIKIEDEVILYSVKDIQRIFNLGKEKSYQLVCSSGFPKIQIGRTFYVPKDKLEKWINGNVGKSITI